MENLLDEILLAESLTYETNVDVVKEWEKDVYIVEGDQRKLKQVFLNLVKNATEAMEHQGTLILRMHRTTPPDSTASHVVVEIVDTGPGIPGDVQKEIFDPFYTTKESGTGLGLAISKKIISAHNGKIFLKGSGDSGTTFKIMLPESWKSAEKGRKNMADSNVQ